ncbi:class E sortase [Nocardioides sp. LHG3406-4]|uniref:class E sortase n=1 Tax=Nocardioides sp. LHG3406-4 TaxID=2804575 RepID=UPI003CEEF59E
MSSTRRWAGIVAACTVLVAAGCSEDDPAQDTPAPRTAPASSPPPPPSATPAPTPSSVPPSTPTQTQPPVSPPEREPEPEPRHSYVTIDALDLHDFPVRRYPGSPDDATGTAIQNAGDMASPRGPRGGVGPGEIGNFLVTGHRLSSSAPLRYSPSLERGDRIRVRSGDAVFVYEVRRTRWTSFRSARSLDAQRAPVPGRPGVEARRPMITLSTCATIEDHAAGNYWADEFDNPEHRIDKIGVLVKAGRA